MATGRFSDTCRANGELDSILQILFGHVVAALSAAAWIERGPIRGKNILPNPFAGGPGIFAVESGRKVDSATAAGEIKAMQFLDPGEMNLQWAAEAFWQKRDSLPQSLAFPDRDLPITEVDVLDSKTQTFEQA